MSPQSPATTDEKEPKLPPGASFTPKSGTKDTPEPKLPPGAKFSMRLPPGGKLDKNQYGVVSYQADPKGTTVYLSGEQKPAPSIDEIWSGLSHEQRDQVFSGLPAEDQARLMEQLHMFGHATGVRAAPEFDWRRAALATFGLHSPMTDPWIKQKVTDLLYRTHNLLPAAGGAVGGVAGGIAGEALGGPPGAMGASIAGAGVGGGAGEALRQAVEYGMGWEDKEEPLAFSDRATNVAKEALTQAGYETLGVGIGRLLRPSMAKSIAKLYYAGGLDVGDRRVKGAVESVAGDFMKKEKAGFVSSFTNQPVKKVKTVGDFIDLLDATHKEIGNQVDAAMMKPVQQGNRAIPLGQAQANTMDIQNSVRSLLTANPSIGVEARLNPTGPEAAYLQRVRAEALKYQSHLWTYTELCDKRIRLNNELEAMYSLPKGEQRKYLLEHPDLLIKKKEADAIRDITYKEMDSVSGQQPGTTLALQTKRGIMMDLSNQAEQHLRRLATGSRAEAGAPLGEKVNVSTFGTSSGRPGFSVHRLHRIIGGRTQEEIANRQAAKAFGHTLGSGTAKVLSSRYGVEVMNAPLRYLFSPDTPSRDEDSGDEGDVTSEAPEAPPPSASTRPAQAPPPASAPAPTKPAQKAETAPTKSAAPAKIKFRAYLTGPDGHRLGTNDGSTWIDTQTGQQVQ